VCLSLLGAGCGTEEPVHSLVRGEAVPAYVVEEGLCAGPEGQGLSGGCDQQRSIFVDLEQLGAGLGGYFLRYDYEQLTRPLSSEELWGEGELSLAVRLVLSEVGADRLVENRWALNEAVGILYTVDNRRAPQVYNPEGRTRAPIFPGCGPGADFSTCANAQQYNGMASWRAMNPRKRYRPDVLEPATDLAVYAWHLIKEGLVADPTGGATNYVHRCGGTAYGLPTTRCDAHIGNNGEDDLPGAHPHTGPIVFRAPNRFLERRGYYSLYESAVIDYERSQRPSAEEDLDAIADAAEP
jgi:hypothetical protein